MKDLVWVLAIGVTISFNSYATPLSELDSTRFFLNEKGESFRISIMDHFSAVSPNANHLLGYTFLSNYYKNVPRDERTADDNVHFRSYIQTTSGSIYYYDEIQRFGRR